MDTILCNCESVFASNRITNQSTFECLISNYIKYGRRRKLISDFEVRMLEVLKFNNTDIVVSLGFDLIIKPTELQLRVCPRSQQRNNEKLNTLVNVALPILSQDIIDFVNKHVIAHCEKIYSPEQKKLITNLFTNKKY